MTRVRLEALLAVLLTAIACEGGPPSPPAPNGAPTEVFRSEHFQFRYTSPDAASIPQLAARLEGEYSRILQDLGVTSMPTVSISYYGTHEALVAGAGPSAGPIPPWATGLVTAQDQIHLMGPSVAGPFDRAVTSVVHEFAHCVSLGANGTIANNPRWLWEAIAVYEAGQRVDPRTLAYLTAGQPPSFSRLNAFDNQMIYDVGYVISEFVVDRWGAGAYRELLRVNGDTARALGIVLEEFEAAWFAWVRNRYAF